MTSSAPGYPSVSQEIIGYDDAYDLLITDSRRIFTQQWNDAEIGLYRDRVEIRQDKREWIFDPLAYDADIFEILELF